MMPIKLSPARSAPARSAPARAAPAVAVVVAVALAGAARPAQAQQAEAKDAARNANCPPGKVETLRQVTGRADETVYKIACTGMKDRFVLVQCRGRSCTVMR
ncbi:hypothetical protein [Rhodospirillum centenum]|uniref:Uncharacterized protein n=1 Tax=Rhodospirillum centenum (strain ATCC 51521 / SW) TaxID=414684 RepID=B6ISZ6_RHOCS|nr:hypothetical protein [Rhodospirillum centenum]ACI98667.1 hypothetical protein RC1_1259 [Rhodospirillum centenum SW]